MSALGDMLGGIDTTLEGAACSGRWDVFDPRHDHESTTDYAARVDQARAICHTCPVFADCAEVLAGLPRSHRAGVWAGRPFDAQGRAVRHLKEKP